MEHKPRGLLSDSERPVNLVGANPILAVHEHPESAKPLVERERAILKDSADFDGELRGARLTLPAALRR